VFRKSQYIIPKIQVNGIKSIGKINMPIGQALRKCISFGTPSSISFKLSQIKTAAASMQNPRKIHHDI